MKVLVACEFTGSVRDAFRTRGIDATSCDLVPSEQPGPHILGDVRDVLGDGWDLMIAHPPCTYLATSGARWWPEHREDQAQALQLVRDLLSAPIPRIAVENPRSIISSRIRRADQVIDPWEFGDPYAKATMLWLVGLPRLVPTKIVAGRERWVDRLPPSADRGRLRSRTFPGIAAAMADQWAVGYDLTSLPASKDG